MDVKTVIQQLSQVPAESPSSASVDLYNPYAPGDANNAIRRENLRRYLQFMIERQPDTMLVMEAPGYRGCRLTGVPVTSRKVLLEGVADLGIFGAAQGYENPNDPGFERVYGEQSATIVWTTLAELNALPILWNTFPFHPHKPGIPLSNRRPRKAEMRLGTTFLSAMMQLFPVQRVVAIGNVAHDTLTGMGISCSKVRHPAQGGKNDFVAGLRTFFHKG
jgi:uracil-DNA glycosylase